MTWYKGTDPSVIAIPIDRYKNGIELADTKLILYSNLQCTRVNGNGVVIPTAFHLKS